MKSAVALCICKTLLMPIFSVVVQKVNGQFFSIPFIYKYPCNDTTDIMMAREPDLYSDKINQFFVKKNRNFTSNCIVTVLFDSDTLIEFWGHKSHPEWTKMVLGAGNAMEKRFLKPQTGFTFVMKGTTSGHPNLTSLIINDIEFCKKPIRGLFNEYVEKTKYMPEANKTETVRPKHHKLDFQCGRRRINRNWVTDPLTGTDFPQDTGSVVDGVSDPGDWPWHVPVFLVPIIMWIDNFKGLYPFFLMCGGTLISHNFVLTAEFCVYNRSYSSPKGLDFFFFFIGLGRKELVNVDDNYNAKVVKIITPISNTNPSLLYSIALLKLRSKLQFTGDIRPACLWHRRKNDQTNDNIVGVLVGWGRTNDDIESDTLQQVNLPMVSRDTCIESIIPTYERYLTEKRFCAGYLDNGTAPCYNDIGGALQVFVPDDATGGKSGTWYVRGIMTLVMPKHDGSCDENAYGIFADEKKFAEWIETNIDA